MFLDTRGFARRDVLRRAALNCKLELNRLDLINTRLSNNNKLQLKNDGLSQHVANFIVIVRVSVCAPFAAIYHCD